MKTIGTWACQVFRYFSCSKLQEYSLLPHTRGYHYKSLEGPSLLETSARKENGSKFYSSPAPNLYQDKKEQWGKKWKNAGKGNTNYFPPKLYCTEWKFHERKNNPNSSSVFLGERMLGESVQASSWKEHKNHGIISPQWERLLRALKMHNEYTNSRAFLTPWLFLNSLPPGYRHPRSR